MQDHDNVFELYGFLITSAEYLGVDQASLMPGVHADAVIPFDVQSLLKGLHQWHKTDVGAVGPEVC